MNSVNTLLIQRTSRLSLQLFGVTRTTTALLVLFCATFAGASSVEAQESDLPIVGQEEEFPLPHLRWVGMEQNAPTVGLFLEFYPDTMLLVNRVRGSLVERHALGYRITEDSILATGDTTIRLRYEMVLDRMIVYTPEGVVITMSSQSELARSFVGRWLGTFETDSTTETILLQLYANGDANWKRLPAGRVNTGEWNRKVRTFTFTWDVDSTLVASAAIPVDVPILDGDTTISDSSQNPTNQWVGYHDPYGNALQFLRTFEGSGSIIFRKSYR
jgi:hypothetical protein